MRRLVEFGAVDSWQQGGARYLLAIALAIVLGLAAAVPVFAADGQYQPSIVGGDPVPIGKYPFMVSLQANTGGASPSKEHFCGATLIDSDSVLTAAHCADYIGAVTIPGISVSYRDVRIVVGLTELDSTQGQVRKIQSLTDISIHPRYDRRRSTYDAAVIDLNQPVQDIAPISLATVASRDRLERPGTSARIAGWGTTKIVGPFEQNRDNVSNRLRDATPPIVSDAECDRAYNGDIQRTVQVCAGHRGEDSCQGDSGGPMWATTKAGRRQIGITSNGVGCGTKRFPGVYTEVNAPAIRTFITQAAGG
ncbi:MAG TPA: serine protease [Rubrobacter sp.]|nr:serine protease [Rubrobacter sp.]